MDELYRYADFIFRLSGGGAMKDKKHIAEKQLIEDFARWDYLYEYGGQDPFWEDGNNLNLVRNHILNNKRRLEELEYFPAIYYRETPQEVDNNYMARADEIREHAKQSLAAYLADGNYQYLLRNSCRIDKKAAKKINLNNVLGYVDGLKYFIEEDSLVDMRRHERTQIYLDSFKECREKIEKILDKRKPEKLGQMDIFDFI